MSEHAELPENREPLSAEEAKRLIHELQVHQHHERYYRLQAGR